MSDSSCCKQRSGLFVLVILAILGAGGYGGYTWYRSRPKPTQPPDMAAVYAANNRGIGLMEQLNEKSYEEAVTVFEDIVRMAPDWIPGRVNLGIALLNSGSSRAAHLARAPEVFEEVSRRDPTNRHAHFCLGLMLIHGGKLEDREPARAHLEAVAKEDPHDPAVWYWLGRTYPDDAPQALECFEKAAQLDPYLKGPMYARFMGLRQKDPTKADALLKHFQAFTQADGFNPLDMKYGQMGRYANVLDRSFDKPARPAQAEPVPAFVRSETHNVSLAPAAQWASAADLKSGPDGQLRQQVRDRFGGVIVALDYNRDGLMDFLLLGAVVEGGKIRDLLLSQERKSQFKDVTVAAGLAKPYSSLGCCVADCDNDGYPDLLLTGIEGIRLLRNTRKGGFDDITAEVGLDKLAGVCLAATFVDLDQDGDLDLVVTRFAASREQAESTLQGNPVQGESSLACFINVGEAPVSGAAENLVPFQPRFRLQEGNPLGRHDHPLGLAVADFDLDRDPDLMVLADDKSPVLLHNDRLLRFHSDPLPETLAPAAKWSGALVLDVNHDERSDVLLIGPKIAPQLLRSNPDPRASTIETRFTKVSVQGPWLMQAQAIDLDLDGWTDVVGLSTQKTPVLLHNEAGTLTRFPVAFEEDVFWPFKGLVVADVDNNGFPDLAAWTEEKGLQFYLNQGNDNHALELELTGLRGASKSGANEKLRSNADGFGVWAVAQTEDFWTGAEKTTLQAGLGQSSQPLILGMGTHDKVNVIRLRWPDNVIQAELNQPTNTLVRITENNRRSGSCPVLFAWDGDKFVFVSDFLGAGALGELSPGGETRMPRPEESVKIEAHQLALRNGEYILKVAEPMDEITYLDRLQLVVVDHPRELSVYPDERFVSSGPSPSQDLLVLDQPMLPEKALDHRGRDVTRKLRDWDRDMVDAFAKRSWLGLSEEHWVELDFGSRLSSLGKEEALVLCLAGWTDYPYPESIWAAGQAGVSLLSPTLERWDDGWKAVDDIGFPAGLPRLMTYPLTGKLKGSSRLRLRTNLDIYWDQIYIAPLRDSIPATAGGGTAKSIRTTKLEVSSALLGHGGFMREVSPDGKQPTLYDYHQLEPVLANRFTGPLTRPGKVTDLVRETDDRFAIFGPGSEVTVRFDARALPALTPGWQRSFVLRTWGYCKDCAPFTATGGKVEPLPFRGMKTYPYEK